MQKVKEYSYELSLEVATEQKELRALKEAHLVIQGKIIEEFKQNMSRFWNFAQEEMNNNKNENFFLNREIQKLTNVKQNLLHQIELANTKLKELEKASGYKYLI